jgi:outer membrane protein assembly factor BamA
LKTIAPYTRILIIAILLAASACNPSNKIARRGGYMLNKISIKTDSRVLTPDELSAYLLQKPSPAFLGVFHISTSIYEMASKWKETGFKRWVIKSFGNKPVMFDSLQMKASRLPMMIYMSNKGYFEPVISDTIMRRGSKVNVIFNVKAGKPYTIRNITYDIKDTVLGSFFLKNKGASLVHEGIRYDSYLLDEERDRITTDMKNNGYYSFSKDFIRFKADSTLHNHQMDIKMAINNIRLNSAGSKDSLTEINHPRYTLNHIYIHPDVNLTTKDTTRQDTLEVKYNFDAGDTTLNRYFLVYHNTLRIKPSALTHALFLRNGEIYRLRDHDLTYKRMTNLPINRFVSISYDLPAGGRNLSPGQPMLNSTIRITRAPVNVFSIDAEGSISSGYLGLGSSVTYNNRNFFRGGETFSVKVKGLMQNQPSPVNSEVKNFLFFNTYETGVDVGLDFPRLLVPVRMKRVDLYTRPKSSINIGVNFQQEPSYKRYIFNTSFGYEWSKNEQNRFIFLPVVINSVSIYKDSTLTYKLDSINDSRLTSQYTDHFISSMSFSYILNTQKLNIDKNFFFIRWNLEPAGNLMYLIHQSNGGTLNSEGQHVFMGIPFAQYLRTDIDFRKYFALTKAQTLVFRTLLGIGVPYGNSKALPFEKGFYAGGSNDMRGWAIRSLGPGTYQTTASNYNNVGDLILESNLEYRFTLYRSLLGAVFADAGNIWLLHENSVFPGGEFRSSLFLKQIALDAGFGFRYDFSFFIFRLDGAVKVKNPANPNNGNWTDFAKMKLSDIIWNFGIGYPF